MSKINKISELVKKEIESITKDACHPTEDITYAPQYVLDILNSIKSVVDGVEPESDIRDFHQMD
jgi:hypothetical protein